MAITLNSVGHFFAKAWTAIKTGEKDVEGALTKVEGTEKTVETATSVIPVIGAPAVQIERTAYAVLGEVSAILAAGDAAAKAKLADAGLDQAVVTQVENLLATAPQLVTVAKVL
jgi:hypothetical protein